MATYLNRAKYPRNWSKVSATIRRLAGGRCEWCGQEAATLSVHHVGAPYADGRPGNPRDKHDLRRENLVALCFSCHDQVDQIRKRRQECKQRRAKRRMKLTAHRALGIGTGLTPWRGGAAA